MIAKITQPRETRTVEHVEMIVVTAKQEITVKEGVGGIKVFVGDKLVYAEGDDDGRDH